MTDDTHERGWTGGEESTYRTDLREPEESLERVREAVSSAGLGQVTLSRLLEDVERLVPDEPSTPDADPGRDTLDHETAAEVLDLLADGDCRCVLAATADGPRTVPELASDCDIARSTVYRKVGKLSDHGLLEEGLRVEGSGPHPNEYHRAVDEVVVALDGPVTVETRSSTDSEPHSREDAEMDPVGGAEERTTGAGPALIQLPPGRPRLETRRDTTRND